MESETFSNEQLQRVLDSYSVGKIESIKLLEVTPVKVLESGQVIDPITKTQITIPTTLDTSHT